MAMRAFIPKRLEPVAFGFLLSGMMSFLVSGLSLLLALGFPGMLSKWLPAWLSAWALAFPAVLVVAPFVRRILKRIVVQ